MQVLPGVLLSAALATIALQAADHLGGGLSGVLLAILLGAFVRNTVPLPEATRPGVKFSVTTLLRLGIVLVGLKLSLVDVARAGLGGLPVVAAAVATGLLVVPWINRAFGLPQKLGTLIAAGTSICGVTAIVTTAPAIEADEREVAWAVATITLFGLVGMTVYPYLVPHLLHTSQQIGMFLGVAIHDTSQVLGAALAYKEVHQDDLAFQTATVTKLTRNLCLALVVPLLAVRRDRGFQWRTAVPGFVLGFVLMALLRTLGDAFWDGPGWKAAVHVLGDTVGSRYLLGTAMAAVGLGTSLEVFQGVGLKPFAVGLLGALAVAAAGLAAILLMA